MHLVLSGYYGFDNIGDEAILFSIIESLRRLDSQIHLTVLSNNPEFTKATYRVHSVNRWNWKEIHTVLKTADGLISGGGSLLQDATSLKSIPYYTGIMQTAMMLKIPVFIYAQGIGPIHKSLSKFIVRTTLNKVAGITVRDKGSLQLLKDIGVNKEIRIVPDPVLSLDGASFSNDWLRQQRLPGLIVTVSVRDWVSKINYKRLIAQALDKIAKDGNSIVFIPMHGEQDVKASKSVAALMKEKSTIAPGNLSMGEKISIIGESDILIGMRLHALIFAAITATPFIALSYDPKVDSFASMVDQPVAGHVNETGWDSDSLTELTFASIANIDYQSALLSEKIKPLKDHAMETAKLALDVFKG
ncbi:polysaccharide pyruvyl transferase CsaB [Pallidibacillus thermolactis]|uniref:polysaccharide pyruvyl transferase CsaB n=1 Tax=Pallidibacillus thermolactis TaxID=251051 RepID=UPI002E1CF01B|nr:polysaccharide pyruvyl transferase CsaB [Pallidibacillus thermolactis]MED1672583.1 polysaccharide pyruvyl transferase CsaB [Pallidibacillus thermolactis subsp. kokeshiiformis]